ncbi:MAG: benzoate-CoA ligase family protein [Geobacteraceae bacterium]|nr:benzoate-CoA ligase family protein [Geobacteraceae bacterium]
MNHSSNAAVALLAPNLASRPDKIALITNECALTYRQLDDLSNRFSSMLRDSGLGAGERVVFAAGDSAFFFIALLGCLKRGAVPVLVNPSLSADEFRYIMQDCTAVALVTESAVFPAFQSVSPCLSLTLMLDEPRFQSALAVAPADCAPHTPHADEIAFLLYSSGSTGSPKGVPHRHSDLLASADAFAGSVLDLNEKDVVFSASKLFFAYGLGNSFSFPLRFGATVVLFSGKPDPADTFRIIENFGVTIFFGVPSAFNMLLKTLKTVRPLGSLRLCVSAGEPLPASICRDWTEITGIEIIDGIGSTEALHIYISNRPGNIRPGSAGRLIPPFEARIVDDDGRQVKGGIPGHLLLRGSCIAPFYLNLPEKTGQAMLAGGWFDTGDIFVQEGGWYTFQGRSDEMFKVDAQWVSPTRVESVLMGHEAVLECALSWRKVESLVRPIAYVVLKEGYEPKRMLERELRRFTVGKLPPYMCPVQVEWVDELPRTCTGKIQRVMLRSAC